MWIAPDADLALAASCIVESKAFDHGLVCGAEQHLVIDAAIYDAFLEALTEQSTHIVPLEQSASFVAAAFLPHGSLRMAYVGQSAAVIAARAGLSASDETRLVAFEADRSLIDGAGATERLAPIVTLYRAADDDDAEWLCRQLLEQHGRGHTAVVHSTDRARIDRFARDMPVSRILVNVRAAQGCGGW